MKFNTRIRRGLRTMPELAPNPGNGEGIYRKDIAKNQEISLKYLDRIIADLENAGLVENVGGNKSRCRPGRPEPDDPVKPGIHDPGGARAEAQELTG